MLRLVLRAALAYLLVAAVWWPFQAAFVAALAGGAQAFLRLVEDPPIVLGLASSGNLIRLTTAFDAAGRPAAVWDGTGLHLYVVAGLAMVLAPPLKDRRRQLRLLGLAFGLAWAATQAITVVQVKSVAEAHAAAQLRLVIHTATETAVLSWASRGLIMVGMLLLPALLFLLAYFAWIEERAERPAATPPGRGPGAGPPRAGRMVRSSLRMVADRKGA